MYLRPLSKLNFIPAFLCMVLISSFSAVAAQDEAKETVQEQTEESSTVSRPIEITTETEDINITYDSKLAREQVKKFPDDPEAHFVLAVTLTRSCKIVEAFKEIRIARRLAQKRGGPEYFNDMIGQYEKILTYYPDDNRIRYHLAWGYYMKAYLLAEYSRRVEASKKSTQLATNLKNTDKKIKGKAKSEKPAKMPRTREWQKEWVSSVIETPIEKDSSKNSSERPGGQQQTPEKELAHTGKPAPSSAKGTNPVGQMTAMEQVMKKAAPSAVPHIKRYYQSALRNLDELLVREPGDVWARLYRAHLNAEYTGDLESAMTAWRKVQKEHPENPAAYFFLGEGYLKKGNLRECLTNVSKAIALRAVGN